MDNYKDITSKLYNYTSTFFTNDIPDNKLANKEILQIGNAISSIFGNIDSTIKIEIPRLVVVGTQSSGKSSLLNGLLSMDLLPTGKTIVTRTPLNLQLNQTSNESKVEFGNYNQGTWKIDKSIPITTPEPTLEEIEKIRIEIMNITDKIAGTEKSVSSHPIYLQIYSPYIPNLSLVDLPGLTMVACTDKGQPKDIKEKIRQLVSSYIKTDNTIILAVMQARSDLETDVGLDLIKEYDPNGDRTLGILTKIDLMNQDSDISDYLLNKVSKDLLFRYGYFAVKNKSNEHLTITEALQEEKIYFDSHPIYSKLECQSNITTPNLGIQLSHILISHLKKSLPTVLIELKKHQLELEKDLLKLGHKLPSQNETKLSYFHQLLSDLSRNYIDSMENRTHSLSYGKKIKDVFIKYRTLVSDIKPFQPANYNNQLIIDAIENAEGNHMSFPIPPVEVLEKCILDNHMKPIRLLYEPSVVCSNSIQELLIELIDILIIEMGISRFPNLTKSIKEVLINKLIKDSMTLTNHKINEAIEMEESYIWTNDSLFLNQLYDIGDSNPNNQKTNHLNLEFIRSILISYYETIKYTIQNNIPKIIMTFLIKYTHKHINSYLFKEINSDNINELLKEDNEIENKREDLINKLSTINNANKILEEYN